MILSAGSTGTDVNSAVTLFEQRLLPGWRVILLNHSTVFNTVYMMQGFSY